MRGFKMLIPVIASFGTLSMVQSEEPATYTVVDKGAAQLREDFNAAKGSVRLLFVVDPICPGCLRGLDDMNRDLLAGTDDPRLRTFVVHVPVLRPPAKAENVPKAATLLPHEHVEHYWNPSGSFGWELSEALGLGAENETIYAWDVWLLYGPEVEWAAANPPQPTLLMHQLRALRNRPETPYLDSKVFAEAVHELLSELPTP